MESWLVPLTVTIVYQYVFKKRHQKGVMYSSNILLINTWHYDAN